MVFGFTKSDCLVGTSRDYNFDSADSAEQGGGELAATSRAEVEEQNGIESAAIQDIVEARNDSGEQASPGTLVGSPDEVEE